MFPPHATPLFIGLVSRPFPIWHTIILVNIIKFLFFSIIYYKLMDMYEVRRVR